MNRSISDLEQLLWPFCRPERDGADDVFHVDGSASHTYGETRRQVSALCGQLRAGDIDEVALVCSNSHHFIAHFIAAALSCRRLYLIGQADVARLRELLPGRDIHVLTQEDQVRGMRSIDAGLAPLVESPSVDGRLEFIGYFTSGTSSSKKLLLLRPRTLLQRVSDWVVDVRQDRGARFLCTTTFAHSHGLNLHLLPAIFLRGVLVAPALDLLTPQTFGRLVRQWQPSLVSAVPSLLKLLARAGVTQATTLRDAVVISGSDTLDEATRHAFEQKFECHILDQYGCAETGPTYFLREAGGRRYLQTLLQGREVDVATAPNGRRTLRISSRSLCDMIVHDGGAVVPANPYDTGDSCVEDGDGLYLAGRVQTVLADDLGEAIDLVALEAAVESRFGAGCTVVPTGATGSACKCTCFHAGPRDQLDAVRAFIATRHPGLRIEYRAVEHIAFTNLGKKIRDAGAYAL